MLCVSFFWSARVILSDPSDCVTLLRKQSKILNDSHLWGRFPSMPPSWLCLIYTPACISRKLSLQSLPSAFEPLTLAETAPSAWAALSSRVASVCLHHHPRPQQLTSSLDFWYPYYRLTLSLFLLDTSCIFTQIYPLMAVSPYPRNPAVGRFLIMSVVQKNARGKFCVWQ